MSYRCAKDLLLQKPAKMDFNLMAIEAAVILIIALVLV